MDSYFKKEIKYKFLDETLSFDVAESLFSTFDIDHGSDVLIRAIDTASPQEILDIGCGYGILGICLAKKFPDAQVTAVDRDLLAVKYSNHNAAKNNAKNFSAIPSLATEQVKDKKFDLIVSNIPAKISEQAILEEFLIQPLSLLNPNGEYWIVIVNALNRHILKLVNQDKIKAKLIRRRSGHIVYKVKR